MENVLFISMILGSSLGFGLGWLKDQCDMYRYRNYEPKVELVNGIATIDVGKMPIGAAKKVIEDIKNKY